VTDWVQKTVEDGGYLILAALILLENLFPPIPSEAILPLAGYQVATGAMDVVPAVLSATAGSLVGALILYAIARFGGRPLLERHGPLLRVTPRQLDQADAWFDRRGPVIVLVGRLIPGVRSLVSLPAGLSELPLALFVALTAAGSLLWNTALISAGWALGDNWQDATHLMDEVGTVVYVALGVAVVAGVALLVGLRARRRAEAGQPSGRSSER